MASTRNNRDIEILIAEDSATQAERLCYLLEQHGYTVTVAPDGRQALAAARERRPALLVSDVMMPKMDGFTLCGEIKRDAQLQTLPVILLTTLSNVGDIMRGLECGADNFIRKPYEDRYLLARIEYLLMHQELRQNQKMQMGVAIYLGGQRHYITADRQQIVDLLISVYEEAVHIGEELKVRQQELARSNSMLSSLYHVAESLNRAMNEREVCEQSLEHAMELPGVTAGWIFLVDGDDFRLAAGRDVAPALFADASVAVCECQRRFIAGALDQVGNVIECDRFCRIGGVPGEPCSHVSIPLWSGGRCIGIMNLAGAEEALFEEEEVAALYGVGHQVGAALERVHLHLHLEQLVAQRTAALTAEIIERKNADNRFHTLFEFAPDAVVMIDRNGRIMLVNRQAEVAFGYRRDELLGEPVEKLMAEPLRHRHAGFREQFVNQPVPRRMGADRSELRGLRSDGSSFPVDVSLSPMEADGGVVVAATVRDITQQRTHEARIARLNRLYSVLSGINTTIVRVHHRQELFDEVCRLAVEQGEFMHVWIGVHDAAEGRMVAVARAGRNAGPGLDAAPVGIGAASMVIQRRQPIICNDIASGGSMGAMLAPGGGYGSAALFPLTLAGEPVGVLALYAADPGLFDEEEIRLLAETAGDISFALDHLEKDARLNYLAYYDALTGLPNHALFLDRGAQKLNLASRDQGVFSVAVLDLNRFSSVNETLGRQAGDDLLCQVADRLRDVLGETDVLARFSADRFGIAFGHDSGEVNLVHLLEKMLASIQGEAFPVGGQQLRLSAKGGIASYPGDGDDIETLLHNAESALKKARLSGDRYLFYAPEFNRLVAEKLSLESRLRRALEERQLELYYQPKVNIASGTISGLEALMRWNEPEVGLVVPIKFIPLMEETGMIMEAGLWALEKAVSDSLNWQQQGLDPPRIAVNVSAIQLQQKDFVQMIECLVRGDRDIARRLELEITESLIMRDVVTNIGKLRAVREMGVEIAIDDFGTGYSSLSHIAKLPVGRLKIDQSFIVNLTSRSDDLNIVSAIISLAHSLKMQVVAEGVENAEQARLLRLLHCDEVQGYLFSPAVPADRIAELLREGTTLVC